jgi:hypothetical protein
VKNAVWLTAPANVPVTPVLVPRLRPRTGQRRHYFIKAVVRSSTGPKPLSEIDIDTSLPHPGGAVHPPAVHICSRGTNRAGQEKRESIRCELVNAVP